jgi:hypothetical protein
MKDSEHGDVKDLETDRIKAYVNFERFFNRILQPYSDTRLLEAFEDWWEMIQAQNRLEVVSAEMEDAAQGKKTVYSGKLKQAKDDLTNTWTTIEAKQHRYEDEFRGTHTRAAHSENETYVSTLNYLNRRLFADAHRAERAIVSLHSPKEVYSQSEISTMARGNVIEEVGMRYKRAREKHHVGVS